MGLSTDSTSVSYTHLQLELRGYPRGKLERDILVRVSPSIASGLGDDTFGVGLFHPLFDGKDETVQSGLVLIPSNSGDVYKRQGYREVHTC